MDFLYEPVLRSRAVSTGMVELVAIITVPTVEYRD
jgi:hypothetical protein